MLSARLSSKPSAFATASVFAVATVVGALAFGAGGHNAMAQNNQGAVQLELEGAQNGLALSDRRNPNAVMRAYYTFISAGQFNEALSLLGPSFGIETVRDIASEMRTLSKRVRDGKVSISLDQVYQQGDWALAVLLINVVNEDGTQAKIVADQYMLRIQNEWTVVPKQLRDDQSFVSFFNDNARLLNQWWKENRTSITARLVSG